MAQAGYTVGIVGVRGEDLPLTSHMPWHPALTLDLETAVRHTHLQLPAHSRLDTLDIFLTGYSAGNNIVQKTLQALHCANVHHHPSGNVKAKQHREQQLIRGALCMCVTYDYERSRQRLESQILGQIYSYFICRVSLNILLRHRDELLRHTGCDVESEIAPYCRLLSDFDARAYALRGFNSEAEQAAAFSMHEACDTISVPTLLVQPADDPLHMNAVRENIDLPSLLRNPHLIFVEPRYGNHFGFYEGSLWEAITSTSRSCYTYPAKLSHCFFDHVLEQYRTPAYAQLSMQEDSKKLSSGASNSTAPYMLRSATKKKTVSS